MNPSRFVFTAIFALAVTSLSQAQRPDDPVERDRRSTEDAMMKGDVDKLDALFQHGYVAINGYGPNEIRLWIEWACYCPPESLQYVLQHGADPLKRNKGNRPALRLCWQTSRLENLELFMEAFKKAVDKAPNPSETLSEQISWAGGTGFMWSTALGAALLSGDKMLSPDELCLRKVKWLKSENVSLTEWKNQMHVEWPRTRNMYATHAPGCIAYFETLLK